MIDTADSFARLDYPRDKLSVIFVDDCSTDDTYDHLLTAQRNHPWMLVDRNPHNMGKRLGNKRAVLTVTSDLVMSVDSDVIVERDAMRNMVRHIAFDRRRCRWWLCIRFQCQ